MAQSVRLEPCLELTQEQIGAFLGHLTDKGCRESSVQKYRRDLTLFYTMLPEDKQIRRGTVSAWRSELVEREPRAWEASSSRTPYPSLRRGRQSSLIPSLLLSPTKPLRWVSLGSPVGRPWPTSPSLQKRPPAE